MSVLLLNMPFAQLCWPNLGLSLLKSALTTRGIDCELKNLCFPLAERVGYDRYDWIAGHFAFVLGGEHLFAREYFGDRLPSTEQFWQDVLLQIEPELDETDRADYFHVGRETKPFLDDCLSRIDFTRYRIVGFTTSYQQTFPSLCLARRIKDRFPETKIVFGGAACEGEMGRELIRNFPEIDYAFLGEADLTFPEVVRRILDGTSSDSPLPDGVLARNSTETLRSEPEARPENRVVIPLPDSGQLEAVDLDRLPLPDFSDYLDELRESPLRGEIRPLLFFETSRGCWWGQRRQCSFCGLNGHSLRFRNKSPRRAVDELVELVRRYGLRDICFADNIFAQEYFDSFLPMLKESGLGLRFEFEMKANQSKDQVRKLLDAGLCAAQLGIETLSTPILRMLNKGAQARHNLQILKWYTEGGAEVKWNILYGFPGEDPSEYERMAALLPLVYHFHPPIAIGRVRVDRFAPYHNDPRRYGIGNLRPFRGFRYLYPFEDASLRRLSYFHDFDFADGRNVEDYVEPFLEAARRWETEYRGGSLIAFDREDGVLLLTDTRSVAEEFQYRLSGLQRELYLFCDTARSPENIRQRFPEDDFESILGILERWIGQKIMLPVDDRYFSLSLSPPGND